MHTRSVAVVLAAFTLAGALTGPVISCSSVAPSPSSSPHAEASAGNSAMPSMHPSVSPTPWPTTASAALPTDCRAILSPDVLAQLGATPLNSPAYGPSGVQSDGSLICIWADPGADTTGITTTISRAYRGEALDMLNGLVKTDGFSCYTPDKGTRCEKEWADPKYPVTDGRTLFWRDDVLIDSRYSNLAPSGYTSSMITAIFG